jgi:membrane-bound lytic murein transglycosylase D
VEISYNKGQWWIADLFSSNGTFADGKRIDHLIITSGLKIELGSNGPLLTLNLISEPGRQGIPQGKGSSLTGYIQRYFTDSFHDKNAGQHTRMIHQAFQVVKKKQSSKYLKVVVIVALLCIVLAAYAVYQNIKANEQRALAESIFYQMKELELKLSEDNLADLNEMKSKYNEYVGELGVYDLDDEEKLILKMARLFGECEINMPDNFVNEVKDYINKWRLSPRLKRAIIREKEQGYAAIIEKEFLEVYLPPQFYYLAVQESSFKYDAVGPKTRFGYAKGIWQFIPQTARNYGLETGPVVELDLYDPLLDERFDFYKATHAAAKYIRDIYNTDAQASGLLVIASYNWGERRVIKYINELSKNPKERNFWNLLTKYRDRIPDETYDYVFYIFSAAVIGENPRLFGFDFDNPLKEIIN